MTKEEKKTKKELKKSAKNQIPTSYTSAGVFFIFGIFFGPFLIVSAILFCIKMNRNSELKIVNVVVPNNGESTYHSANFSETDSNLKS